MLIGYTSKSFTGREIAFVMLANRSKPRPLLVVHSGNRTSGRPTCFAFWRISSKVDIEESELASFPKGGTCPQVIIMLSNETSLKPEISARRASVLLDIAADPVPVFLPGLTRCDISGTFTREATGIA